MKSVIIMFMAVLSLNFAYAQDAQFPEPIDKEPQFFF